MEEGWKGGELLALSVVLSSPRAYSEGGSLFIAPRRRSLATVVAQSSSDQRIRDRRRSDVRVWEKGPSRGSRRRRRGEDGDADDTLPPSLLLFRRPSSRNLIDIA